MPWPNSSRSGSWCCPTVRPSATVADSSDSSAPSAATANADGASVRQQVDVEEREARRGQAGWAACRAWPAERAATRQRQSTAATAASETGIAGRQRVPTMISAATARVTTSGAAMGVLEEMTSGIQRGLPGLVSGARRAQHGRYLLQDDDDGDAGGEALDHRRRQVARGPAEPQERGDDQNAAGEQARHQHAVDAVAVHDRDQHHRHRAGRAGHLQVRSAEDGRQRTGDDRGDQARPGAQSRRGTERQRQRQRHDGDGQPGGQIRPRVATDVSPVLAIRQQPQHP